MHRLAERLRAGPERWRDRPTWRRLGRLEAAGPGGLLARLPGGRVGERVEVGPRRRPAVVIGFSAERAVLAPLGPAQQLRAGAAVRACGTQLAVGWSPDWLGRVLDPLGRPLDGRPAPRGRLRLPLEAAAPAALERQPISAALDTGVRAIDGLCCLGRGQRLGLFAPAGVGKSTLLGQIARGTAADCTVLCLVGERGREVREFLQDGLGAAGRRRCAVVCATADAPAGVRALALPAATALAEGFRRAGRQVLLLADSLTRHARALRELALAAGEPPSRRGYPASVFDRIAALLERAGTDGHGAVSAIYTVLTEDRADDDPLAQEVRGMLDGHVVLDRQLARAGCYPAIDPCASLSRLMPRLVAADQLRAAAGFRRLWATYAERADLIAAGAYAAGSEPETDRAVALRPRLLAYLAQPYDAIHPAEQARAELLSLMGADR